MYSLYKLVFYNFTFPLPGHLKGFCSSVTPLLCEVSQSYTFPKVALNSKKEIPDAANTVVVYSKHLQYT